MVLSEAPVCEADLEAATADDPLLAAIVRRVLTGAWRDILPAEEPFFMMRSQLTVANGILLLDSWVVIPSALQQPVLKLAHEGHPGSATFKDTLRRSVWWPRMSRDAEQFAAACDICWRSRTNHSQELQPTEVVPVWHKVAVDLVEIEGRHLLSLVDYGSRFPELIVLPGTKSQHVVMALSTIFARFGIPLELVSDNGPQFVSAEMGEFL
ncbi:uncharacterized protein K02A2.6-like [Sycon ciliatum]|uniref:uncharacterized protein K02A2.6-like n=1 Tax=Sycon ciliatum TaxID=27933 RepID=UPI0031F5F30B